MALTKKDLDNFRERLVEVIDQKFRLMSEDADKRFEGMSEGIDKRFEGMTKEMEKFRNSMIEVMDDKFDAINEHFASKNDLHIMKKEILDTVDEFAKEIRDNRDERIMQAEQIRRNTGRIEKVESKVGIGAS
jgi:DNA anti-recombination protein RmuC